MVYDVLITPGGEGLTVIVQLIGHQVFKALRHCRFIHDRRAWLDRIGHVEVDRLIIWHSIAFRELDMVHDIFLCQLRIAKFDLPVAEGIGFPRLIVLRHLIAQFAHIGQRT